MSEVVLSSIPLTRLRDEIKQTLFEVLEESKRKELSEKFLGSQQVCELFNPKLSKTTLAKYTNQGLLKGYFIGGKLVYQYQEVIDMVTKIKKYKRV